MRGEAPSDYRTYSSGLRFMLKAGTVRTKTTASDLETTAYFLGQLRDYVHLKSSEEGKSEGRWSLGAVASLFLLALLDIIVHGRREKKGAVGELGNSSQFKYHPPHSFFVEIIVCTHSEIDR